MQMHTGLGGAALHSTCENLSGISQGTPSMRPTQQLLPGSDILGTGLGFPFSQKLSQALNLILICLSATSSVIYGELTSKVLPFLFASDILQSICCI